jgi:hypothetical protein
MAPGAMSIRAGCDNQREEYDACHAECGTGTRGHGNSLRAADQAWEAAHLTPHLPHAEAAALKCRADQP